MPPLYEYECPEHGIIEVWQGISEHALRVCPAGDCDCEVERLISRPAGCVMEPKGHYIPAPGLDKKGRMNEVKISPQESERNDRSQRDAMMATRARAIKSGLTPHFGEKPSTRRFFS